MADWDSMTPRERDYWIAKCLFGWRRDIDGCDLYWQNPKGLHLCHESKIPKYTTNANADYAVLEFVRENWPVGSWKCERFCRWIATTYGDNGGPHRTPPQYRIGSYSRAAFETLKEDAP
jgi:hypothetical protein